MFKKFSFAIFPAALATLAVLVLLISPAAVCPVFSGETVDGQGTAKLPDSGVYEGNFSGGLFNGKGSIAWRNGNRYDGQFKDGLFDGKGTLSDTVAGYNYTGGFKDGLRGGEGLMTFSDGSRYEGGFKDSKFSGRGALSRADGFVIVGIFNNGLPDGEVRISGPGSYLFEGEFRNNEMKKGRLSFQGEKYEGGFAANKFEGVGRLWRRNGDKYEGEFSAGLIAGKGRYVYADKSAYEGTFNNGQPEGEGVFYQPDGKYYAVEYKEGKQVRRGNLKERPAVEKPR